jgi:hypothetical protein
MHPALERLAIKAKERFGVSATTVSLMDRDQQRFLADSSCTFLEDSDTVPRASASTFPFPFPCHFRVLLSFFPSLSSRHPVIRFSGLTHFVPWQTPPALTPWSRPAPVRRILLSFSILTRTGGSTRTASETTRKASTVRFLCVLPFLLATLSRFPLPHLGSPY